LSRDLPAVPLGARDWTGVMTVLHFQHSGW
jgi:hypothetical protein